MPYLDADGNPLKVQPKSTNAPAPKKKALPKFLDEKGNPLQQQPGQAAAAEGGGRYKTVPGPGRKPTGPAKTLVGPVKTVGGAGNYSTAGKTAAKQAIDQTVKKQGPTKAAKKIVSAVKSKPAEASWADLTRTGRGNNPVAGQSVLDKRDADAKKASSQSFPLASKSASKPGTNFKPESTTRAAEPAKPARPTQVYDKGLGRMVKVGPSGIYNRQSG